MLNEQELYGQLLPLMAEVLGVKPERIQLKSVLVKDLGAESLDLLDLSFRIEEHFGVRIEADEIEREARKRLPDGNYEVDGCLTEEALEQIRQAVPELDASKLVKGLKKMDLPMLLTVEFFVHLIQRKLREKEEPSHA